ncbi:phosphoglucosamine mutase [uncultured Pseudacidovorax sp.]|uniref:phosphoglucosamine mutase n=1 Tax=uncultured Pseudacidovorax sp. TaxID=679313 RepID=UPI0025F65CC8|nr:phosphoglucosamine mutase [uncultured Pseudacidovorax sp.]
MTRQYFGTDGIRGTVGQAPITPDFVLRLAHAVGRVLKRKEARPTVLIGKDTRISGYMLESAMESGFNSAGVDVLLLGPLPTPGVAYLTRAQRASMGVVISASHNAYPDNGIKFFSAQGTKLSDAAGRYIEFCKSTFPTDLSLRGMRLVVDAAHGAAYQVAPNIFHELGADVASIGVRPDGLNINKGVGATHPGALVAEVRAQGADYGIALDGDADRLQMVDASGRLFNGDELLYLMAMDRVARGMPVEGVVGTLMTNKAVEVALRNAGIDFVRAKVGDRYVLEELDRRGWLLGGEGSGHLLALDRHTTGDGLVSALQVLQAIVRRGRSMAELLAEVQLFPQSLVNVRLVPGQDWKSNPALAEESARVEAELGDQGRVLIRASGTEPLLRVMVEAPEEGRARALASRIAATVAAA